MNCAVVLAAGSGTRLKNPIPKAFLKINDECIFLFSLKAFAYCSLISTIVLVVPSSYLEVAKKEVEKANLNKKVFIIEGGLSRQESVYKSLVFLSKVCNNSDLIYIHDSARIFIDEKTIKDLYETIDNFDGAMSVYPCVDTIIKAKENVIENIPKRDDLYCESTPSLFRYGFLLQAHIKALEEGISNCSDDAKLMMVLGGKIKIHKALNRNFKITFEEDLEMARFLLKK